MYFLVFQILNRMIDALDSSERVFLENGLTPFISQTTLEAFRMTIRSVISLVEEMLQDGYTFVLTGKFNQDCIEVNIDTN